MSTRYEIECSGCDGTLRPKIPGEGMADNHEGEHIRCGRCGKHNFARYDKHRVDPGPPEGAV